MTKQCLETLDLLNTPPTHQPNIYQHIFYGFLMVDFPDRKNHQQSHNHKPSPWSWISCRGCHGWSPRPVRCGSCAGPVCRSNCAPRRTWRSRHPLPAGDQTSGLTRRARGAPCGARLAWARSRWNQVAQKCHKNIHKVLGLTESTSSLIIGLFFFRNGILLFYYGFESFPMVPAQGWGLGWSTCQVFVRF